MRTRYRLYRSVGYGIAHALLAAVFLHALLILMRYTRTE
jgi:hypothetical protein